MQRKYLFLFEICIGHFNNVCKRYDSQAGVLSKWEFLQKFSVSFRRGNSIYGDPYKIYLNVLSRKLYVTDAL